MLVEHRHDFGWQVVADGVFVFLSAFARGSALGGLLTGAENVALEDALLAQRALDVDGAS